MARINSEKIKLSAEQINSGAPKYKVLADAIVAAIDAGRLHSGDCLPSVKKLSAETELALETIFKAYSLLKEQGVIVSIPAKGYYVAEQMQKVFVMLDTFKAYKEVLYDSLLHNLPKNIIVDVNFHHFNPHVFKRLLDDGIGRYSKYIVMPFEHADVEEAMAKIAPEKLLVIDWNMYVKPNGNVLYQEYSSVVEEQLCTILHRLRRYSEFHLLYPSYTNHPYATVEAFERFCNREGIKHKVVSDVDNWQVADCVAYLSVSDRMLARMLEQCRERKLQVGEDVGIISYNETPMKRFIDRGITVLSTDFAQMGQQAAQFVTGQAVLPMNKCIETKLILRESL